MFFFSSFYSETQTEDVKHPRCFGVTLWQCFVITTSADLGSSFDLDPDQLSITADVKVIVPEVGQPVGEVQHGAVGKLDVELLHVEVDVALKGNTRL